MPGTANARTPLVILVLILFAGPLLLYAYRSQTPAIQTIGPVEVIDQIRGGSVREVIVEGDRVTVTRGDGSRLNTIPGDQGGALVNAVTDYNRANPGRPIALRYESPMQLAPTAMNLVLSLLPILLLGALGALVVAAAGALSRTRTGDRYEQLTRAADLRDRGVLTEDEFQAEKRRIMR